MSFDVGEIVALKANPSVRGAVVRVLPGAPEKRYDVFHDGTTRTYYESQLELCAGPADRLEAVSLPDFHAYLSALQIRHPSFSLLYSLNAGRIDFVPYQFRPVLKFIRSDRPRLLIADGVGVGKTIEAGLILRELQARRELRSVVILCPKPLVVERKWEQEMRRFDERFSALDGDKLRDCIRETDLDGVWPAQYDRIMIPFSVLDGEMLTGRSAQAGRQRRRGLLNLDPPPRFDLVIVDEAHHARNTQTLVHQAIRFFCDNAEAVLFLTATPIQLGSNDLFVLLNLLRPDLVIDEESFEHMAAPNPHLNQAIDLARAQPESWQAEALVALEAAAATSWGETFLRGNPLFQRVRFALAQPVVTSGERVAAINDLEQLHTFSGIINRTRRRDIGDFTLRNPETVPVDLTPQQLELHERLLAAQARVLARLQPSVSLKFMMTTIRRQAASCLYGLAPLVEEILTRRLDELALDELALDEAGSPADLPDDAALQALKREIADVVDLARRLDPHDPKLDAVRRIVREKQLLPNNKLMLFSSFRHTLAYLHQHLRSEGVRVGLVHGGTLDEERRKARESFSLPREDPNALDVLLFSEVGCEGLDYQFCDAMVNYDLPWNPMRIDQRIGRIDRMGQTSSTVAIYNLITAGTIDEDIYERCLLRIGVFHRALGASEEILGQITRDIHSIADNLELTPDDKRAKLQQLADNEIRRLQEQERLEDAQVSLFGIRLAPDVFRQEVEEASSFWLSPQAIENLVSRYLATTCGPDREHLLGAGPLKTLRVARDARERLRSDFLNLPRSTSLVFRDWERWLKGDEPHLAVTFVCECARDHREAALLTPVHPLVRQAAMHIEHNACPFVALSVADDRLPEGEHPFAIYQWEYRGVRDEVSLHPVCADPQIAERLVQLLEKARCAERATTQPPPRSSFDSLESAHHASWAKAREDHRQRTRQVAQHRRESLATSHQARLAVLREQLDKATDDGIRRMRESQLASAEADYGQRLQEIDRAAARADITTQPVAFGTIQIRRENTDAQRL